MRAFLLAIFLAVGQFATLAENGPYSQSPKDVVRLKTAHNITLNRWNNRIVAAVAQPQNNVAFYSFAAPSFLPEKVVVPGLDQIISLVDATDGPVALGERDGVISLSQKQDGRWTHIPMPSALGKDKQERLIPATRGFGILTKNQLFHFVEGKWSIPVTLPVIALKNEPFKRLSKLNVPFRWTKWSGKQALVGSHLYVSWFYGPYGGIIASSDTARERKSWAAVDTVYPPTVMTLTTSGNFWIASENHAETIELSLYLSESARWKQIAQHNLDKASNTFTYGDTVITDLTTDASGKVYLLTGSLGHLDVMTREDGKLRSLTHCNFDVDQHYKLYPTSLAVDDENDFITSADYFDLFYFHKSGANYILRQIILPD